MTFDQYAAACELSSLTEVDKVCYIAYFLFKTESLNVFTVSEASRWLTAHQFAPPNQSRLNGRLRSSRNTVAAERGFALSRKFVEDLNTRFPQVSEKSQDVQDEGTILPEVDYRGTRGYIESLAKQLNAAYEQNIFDGCAVLMRRLVEVLLILSYRKFNIESVIQNSAGNYMMLDGIIADAKTNSTLALSRNSKASLDLFRELGNFSAHKIEYICRREYIKPHILEYRALFVELLHKSGIRV